MSIFNRDHYPTPPAVIDMMVGGLDLAGKHVLEPSAGAGNIIDHLTAMGAIVTSCEKQPDLAKICSTKSKFLKHDFIEVKREEVSHVDFIVMNPPFSADAQHMLHAWEIAPDGCEVISLCNWETINNKYTTSRSQLGRLIGSYGHATNLGDVFKSAERTTSAEIGLVHLYKPASEKSFDGFFDDQEDEKEEQYNGIMPYNAVREAVQRYVAACKLFDHVAENAVQMDSLVGVFGVDKLVFALKQNDKDQSVSDFKVELQKRAWQWVFSKMDMQKFMTSKLKEELNKFVEKQKNVPFTMRNIYRMFEMVLGTHQERMNRVMVEVFDMLTDRHHENRYHIEGWKTNSHYMVNKKFIIEGIGELDNWNTAHAKVRYGGRNTELLDDLTKALCYLNGTKYQSNDTLYNLFRSEERTREGEDGKRVLWKDENGRAVYIYKEWGTWYEWGFFKVKIYKKGTLHAQFLDVKLWEQFNRSVAKAKGYALPEKV